MYIRQDEWHWYPTCFRVLLSAMVRITVTGTDTMNDAVVDTWHMTAEFGGVVYVRPTSLSFAGNALAHIPITRTDMTKVRWADGCRVIETLATGGLSIGALRVEDGATVNDSMFFTVVMWSPYVPPPLRCVRALDFDA